MRAITKVVAIMAAFASMVSLQAQETASPQANGSSKPTSWVQRLDIDQLDPNVAENLAKIYLLLRSEDIPKAQRLEYARSYLRGDYKYARPITREIHEDYYWCAIMAAIVTIGKLNDVASIPLLEEKLQQWETEQKKPIEERTLIAFDPVMAQAVLARLKAVRDIPEAKDAVALIQRLERMLTHIGFKGSRNEFVRVVERRYQEAELSSGLGLYDLVIIQYGQMILEAGWNGVDVSPAIREIQLNLGDRAMNSIQAIFEVYARVATIPREKVAQWIVDDMVNWQRITTREEYYMQVLADFGVATVPLVWSKLEWAARHRDQIKGNGMGLVALMEVLVTTGREQALPLIEPFVNDEHEWVRYYACRAKEYIQQGKVFDFAVGVNF